MTYMNNTIGDRIRNLRKNNGMSQRKLADLMELNHSAICKMENGKSYPSRKNAEKLAHIFAVDLSTFYEPEPEDIKEITLEEVAKVTYENAMKIFEI